MLTEFSNARPEFCASRWPRIKNEQLNISLSLGRTISLCRKRGRTSAAQLDFGKSDYDRVDGRGEGGIVGESVLVSICRSDKRLSCSCSVQLNLVACSENL